MVEQWKKIPNFESYEVSNLGRVRSTYKNGKNKILKPSTLQKGYLRVFMSNGVDRCRFLVHRLVAEAFVPNTGHLPYINHKDENKANNRSDNLEWCTNEYNQKYGTRGVRSGMNRRKPIIVTDKKSGDEILFESMKEVAEYFKVPYSSIIYFCKTKRDIRSPFRERYEFRYAKKSDEESRNKKNRRDVY